MLIIKWQEVLMQEMWETLTVDQKKALMKRIVDEKILGMLYACIFPGAFFPKNCRILLPPSGLHSSEK